MSSKKAELKEKPQDANLSLPIKNPNPLLENGFRIPKLAKNWADSGFELPTLKIIHTKYKVVLSNPQNLSLHTLK